MLREAFDYVGHRSTMSVLRFRQQAWHETAFGPGDMAGIALFFPRVTTESLQECVRESLVVGVVIFMFRREYKGIGRTSASGGINRTPSVHHHTAL